LRRGDGPKLLREKVPPSRFTSGGKPDKGKKLSEMQQDARFMKGLRSHRGDKSRVVDTDVVCETGVWTKGLEKKLTLPTDRGGTGKVKRAPANGLAKNRN